MAASSALQLPTNRASETTTSTKVMFDINNIHNRQMHSVPNLSLCNHQNFIISMKQDIQTIFDACNKLLYRINDFQNCTPNYIPSDVQKKSSCDSALYLQGPSNSDDGAWITVRPRNNHGHRKTTLPEKTGPQSVLLKNSYDALINLQDDTAFPTLEAASAFRYRKNTTNISSDISARPARQSCSLPPINYTHRTRNIFPPNQLKYNEVSGHVLDAPKGYAKGHSVDQTFQMSAGIAIDFRTEFGQVDSLLKQNKKVGETAVLKDSNNDYILYMISKRKHYYKPTEKYESLFKSNYIKALYGLRKTCINLKIKKLAIPKMGCNCDQLSWDNFMKPSILKIFNTVPMEILVCDSAPR
jgi:hypothetical protein